MGRSISRTRSSTVRAFCVKKVWASESKAADTAALVSCEMIVSTAARSGA
jgi:hypothetical protein